MFQLMPSIPASGALRYDRKKECGCVCCSIESQCLEIKRKSKSVHMILYFIKVQNKKDTYKDFKHSRNNLYLIKQGGSFIFF